jgi:uncharacterized protein
VDSAYLLCAGLRCGADLRPYYVKTQFQPDFEYRDAMRLCEELGVVPTVLRLDALADPDVRRNGPDRCYYCKQHIMSAITSAAAEDGYDIVCDGTNASDDADDRPGFRALGEYGVRSPLRECGLTKADIRKASKEAGLPTWNKPAYACLATRILTGEAITEEKLCVTEKAESILFDMGFRDFRVRMRGNSALVQIEESQHEDAVKHEEEIREALSELYDEVKIDGSPRISR